MQAEIIRFPASRQPSARAMLLNNLKHAEASLRLAAEDAAGLGLHEYAQYLELLAVSTRRRRKALEPA